MEEFAKIGELYFIGNCMGMVIENNLDDKTTTLLIISVGDKKGKKITIPASSINELEIVGITLPMNDRMVTKNGRQFVKSSRQRVNH